MLLTRGHRARHGLWELENLLDEDPTLSAADRLTIHEQLDELRSGELTEDEAAERWVKIKKLAPSVIESGRAIVVTVVTAAIQKQLGLQ